MYEVANPATLAGVFHSHLEDPLLPFFVAAAGGVLSYPMEAVSFPLLFLYIVYSYADHAHLSSGCCLLVDFSPVAPDGVTTVP